MRPEQWMKRGDLRAYKKDLEQRRAEAKATSLVTAEERAALPREELAFIAYGRWMELRMTGRVVALGITSDVIDSKKADVG